MTTKVRQLIKKGNHPPQRCPWRFCAACEWYEHPEGCINEPYEHFVKADRRGCRFWECLVCGEPYDELDEGGNLKDHSLCLFDAVGTD